MAEPVDLDDIKRHLVLDPDDTSEDDYLTSMIVGARRACELRTRRSIVGGDRVLVLPAFPSSHPVLLGWLVPSSPAAPIDGLSDVPVSGGSIAAVTVMYFDGSGNDVELDPADYYASLESIPAVLRPVEAWPQTQARPDAVRIEYTLSPMNGADLEIVRHAIRLIVGSWYANREAVSVDVRGIPTELPISVTWLLDPLVAFASD